MRIQSAYATRKIITQGNLAEIKQSIPVDQRDELAVGCETWGILYGSGQRGQMTVWPNGRAALCTGGDSMWGGWDANAEGNGYILRADDTDEDGYNLIYDESGELLPRATQD